MDFTRITPALLIMATGWAATPDRDLQDLLSRMDQAAGSFQAMSANVKYVTHTAVLDDNSEEGGSVLMKKVRANLVQGLIDFTTPDRRTVTIEQRKVQIYTPNMKTVQIFDLGKHGEQLDQFILIGFATSGTELARDYSMKFLGLEKALGEKTIRIELTPKSEQARDYLQKLDLWIPERPAQPYPIQEKIYQKSGDYRLVTYSEMKINPPLKPDALKLKLPAGVKTEYPQK
ncbi:MAG: outer membrane lipoprotein carrier protein LolA [Acidobacteriota bacterium]|nr:outer membrane lipoprotein carrier protein LolA [Acidobacteriota bacterium]